MTVTYITAGSNLKLRCDFDPEAQLEIMGELGHWVIVSPEVFRSWSGHRRINGQQYEGHVYFWLSNEVAREI